MKGSSGRGTLLSPAGGLVLCLIALAAPSTAQTGTWNVTGSLTTWRVDHTATLLPSGKVLVAGGSGGLMSAELYDPAIGTWSATGGMTAGRYGHSATLLPSGKVLVAGGDSDNFFCCSSNSGILGSAELYDPATGTWSATASLSTARYLHTATLLPNGDVLVAGGLGASGTIASAEVYDSIAGTWSSANSLSSARYAHSATLLPNGTVLVAGGFGGWTSAEVYDPATGTWSTTGSMAIGRLAHTATLLANGTVLVAGGNEDRITELYDPVAGTWSATGSLITAHELHSATRLSNGTVLVAGGIFFTGTKLALARSDELYDPTTGTWSPTDTLTFARYAHTATLLPNGTVLVAGGWLRMIAELYDPTPLVGCAATPQMGCQHPRHGSRFGLNTAARRLRWAWLGGSSPVGLSQFGDPVSGSTDYRLCVYDTSAGPPSLAFSATVPARGTCGAHPCWKHTSNGFSYTNAGATPEGVSRMALQASGTRGASIVVHGGGANLGLPVSADGVLLLQEFPEVIVQLDRSDAPDCWEAVFTRPATHNTRWAFVDTLH